MLPAVHRLRDGDGFRIAIRGGDRAKARTLVAHLRLPPVEGDFGPEAALVGFVVSRQVGSAVVRNRVKRRLRHVIRDRLGVLPRGCTLVVRALPSSACASSGQLASDVDRTLTRLGLGRP